MNYPQSRARVFHKDPLARDRRIAELRASGAMSDPDQVRERVQAEAVTCPQCDRLVHPDNWKAHCDEYHDGAYGDVVFVDAEFEALLPPLSEEEFAGLEASILAEGVRDPVIVWRGHRLLIDGHHRWQITRRHGLECPVREMDFEGRDDVLIWMIRNQLHRRNVSRFVRTEKALLLKEAIERKKRANRLANLKQGDEVPDSQNSDAREYGRTDEEIAAVAHVSRDTVRKVEAVLQDAPEPIRERARRGDLSINRAHELAKALSGQSQEIAWAVAAHGIDDPETVKLLADMRKRDELAFFQASRDGQIAGVPLDAGAAAVRKAWRSVQQAAREERQEAAQKRLPDGVYSVIYADPAWQYGNSGLNGSAEQHYATMPVQKICDLPQEAGLEIADNAALLLWVPASLLPDGLRVMSAWGFEYKTHRVWVKDKATYGKLAFYQHTRHELLLLGTRGQFKPEWLPDSVVEAPRSKHSAKPDCVRDDIERMYPGQRYIELFARGDIRRPGWDFWGDEHASDT